MHFPEALPVAPVRGVPSKRCTLATRSLQDALFASQEKFFQELFDSELASQATAEFEKAMKELAEEEPHLVEQFQKLSEAAGRVGEAVALGGWKYLSLPLPSLLHAEGTLIFIKLIALLVSLPLGGARRWEEGRGPGTLPPERGEAEKSQRRLLKTDRFKGHSVVGVIAENKVTPGSSRFVKVTVKRTMEDSEIRSASDSPVNAAYSS